jgi:hypothetical protein
MPSKLLATVVKMAGCRTAICLKTADPGILLRKWTEALPALRERGVFWIRARKTAIVCQAGVLSIWARESAPSLARRSALRDGSASSLAAAALIRCMSAFLSTATCASPVRQMVAVKVPGGLRTPAFRTRKKGISAGVNVV